MSNKTNEALFIRVRREELGLTQDELAKAVGKTSKQYIANIESGHMGLPIWMLRAFAEALKVDVKRLIFFRLKAYEEEIREVVFGSKGHHK
jgi:transcriptional regulator with XRE-family HTH domain